MKECKKMIKQLTDDELMEMAGGFEISISQKTNAIAMLKYGVYPVRPQSIDKVTLLNDKIYPNRA